MDLETRRYRMGVNRRLYHQRLIISCLSCLILGVGATLVVGHAYFYDHDEVLAAVHEKEISGLIDHYETRLATTTAELTEAKEIAEEQLEEVERLYAAQQELSAADFNLLHKYWFLFRYGPTNGTITLDAIRYADDQCKKWDIDPYWLWYIYNQESDWNIHDVNIISGARGIGQVLPSTGQAYWEKVLGHGAGSFNVMMLNDIFVNIEITTAHLGRDLANGSTFKQALNHYSGGGGDAYIRGVQQRAARHGITLSLTEYHYR